MVYRLTKRTKTPDYIQSKVYEELAHFLSTKDVNNPFCGIYIENRVRSINITGLE